jgi:uncharacterized protein (TIGR00297 family)
MRVVNSLFFLRLTIGLFLSVAIGGAGYRLAVLDGSGVIGAVIIGTLITGLGGWTWAALLVAFFVSSSALSFYRVSEKEPLAEKFAKDQRRDLTQTLANGGIVALLAGVSQLCPADVWFFAAAGAMAAVNADTWATELGVLSSRPPRLITSGERADAGTSGGVTWLGSAASLGGALLIGLLGSLELLILGRDRAVSGAMIGSATVGGLVGCVADSLLGATVQGVYWCDVCRKETESRTHRCGSRTHLVRGWGWLGNDLVNAVSSATGALVAALAGWGLT